MSDLISKTIEFVKKNLKEQKLGMTGFILKEYGSFLKDCRDRKM